MNASLKYSAAFCDTARHLQFIHANLQLTLIEAKQKFQLGDMVAFEKLDYTGMIVGFAEDKDGMYDGSTLPILVKIDQKFVRGNKPFLTHYHHDQLILTHRPEIGLALV